MHSTTDANRLNNKESLVVPQNDTIEIKPSKPSLAHLLDLDPSEKKYISLMNVISGFSLMSGPTSVIEANITSVTMLTTLGSVGALGIVGGVAGAYHAHQQISTEQEKIIRLNKEFFIMLNIAADKYQEWQKKLESAALEKEYYDFLFEIQLAISLPETELKNIKVREDNHKETDQANAKYTADIYKMDARVKEYAKHRFSAEGKEELKLWELLKEKNIQREDKLLQNYFINYSSSREAKEYYNDLGEEHRENYENAVKKIKNVLKEMERNRELDDDEEYKNSKILLIELLEQLYDVGKAYSKRIKALDKGFRASAQVKVIFYLETINQAFSIISNKINPGYKSKLSFFDSDLIPLIEKIENTLNCLFNEKTKGIPDMTPQLFGENGSFRHYWRDLENKTFHHDGEALPLNLDQNIYRGGEKPSYTTMGIFGAGIATGLFTAGKGLYVAAVALGACAISATGIGLVVGAIALALTLVCLYCYYKSQKAQNNRNVLAKRLEHARILMLSKMPKKAVDSVKSEEAVNTAGLGTGASLFSKTVVPNVLASSIVSDVPKPGMGGDSK